MRSAQLILLPYFFLIGHKSRRALSRLALSGQELMVQSVGYLYQLHLAHQQFDRFLQSAKPCESSGHHNDPNPLATNLG
jgi:hypothetical protein